MGDVEGTDKSSLNPILTTRLRSVEHAQIASTDYIMFSFDDATFLVVYSTPVVRIGGEALTPAAQNYEAALQGRVGAIVTAAWATPAEIVVQFNDESELGISIASDVTAPEAAELVAPNRSGGEDWWIWRPGEWPGFKV